MTPKSSMHARLIALRYGTPPERVADDAKSVFDQRLMALIVEPLRPGETAAVGYDRKEREIGTLLGTLGPSEAWHLHRRLETPSDELAVAFMRITRERRIRLLAFLGDPKRRAALAAR